VNWSSFLATRELLFVCLLVLAPLQRNKFNPNVISESGTQSLINRQDGRTVREDQQFYDSGDGFLRVCSAPIHRGEQIADDVTDARACESYVAGLADGVVLQHIWSRSHGDRTPAAFCVQFEDVPTPKLVEAVLQYLKENPDRKSYRASIAVEEVLHAKFPCK